MVTFQLALEVIDFSEALEEDKKYVISRQILRSGTSIGANSKEAQGAKSKSDFIHELKIAYKEAEELTYWLELCKHSKNYTNPTSTLEGLLESSKKPLGKIIASSKRK